MIRRLAMWVLGLTDLDVEMACRIREAFLAVWVEPKSIRSFCGQEMRRVLAENVEKE